MNPSPSGRGLSLSIAPVWGNASSRSERLWFARCDRVGVGRGCASPRPARSRARLRRGAFRERRSAHSVHGPLLSSKVRTNVICGAGTITGCPIASMGSPNRAFDSILPGKPGEATLHRQLCGCVHPADLRVLCSLPLSCRELPLSRSNPPGVEESRIRIDDGDFAACPYRANDLPGAR